MTTLPCTPAAPFWHAATTGWRKGVVLHYLPPYSPELNLIEIVWRKIKYEWLPLSCYASYGTLKQAVLDILSKFGDEYRVTFV
ncbi:transposase [Methylovulum miyakonense]|uniref:transposase n=1 Tax=Methylovulum miyakonense TaxID=645578 RepID=UPI0012EC8715